MPLTTTALAVLASTGDAAPSGGAAGAFAGLLPFILIAVIFYLLIIRPQRNRQKQQAQMISKLQVGDQVVTIGGFHGTVSDVSEDVLRVEIAPGTTVTLSKQAVSRRLTEDPEPDTGDLELDVDDDEQP